MLNFNFYFLKFCKKNKNKILKTKVVKQKLKKIFQHVFKLKKHVELKFLKFIKHVKIILQNFNKTCSIKFLINQNNMFYKNNLFFQHVF